MITGVLSGFPFFFFDVMFSECVQMHFLRKQAEEEGTEREAVETGCSVFCLEL